MNGIIDLEIATPQLAEFVRERIKEQRICSTSEFALPGLAGSWLLERFQIESVAFLPASTASVEIRVPLPPEIAGTNPVRVVSGREIRVAARARLRLARAAALAAAGREAVDTGTGRTEELVVDAVFRVSISVAGTFIDLCFDFLGLRSPGGGGLLQGIPGFQPQRVCVSVGLNALSSFFGAPPIVVNAGMATSPGTGGSLILRLEVNDFDAASFHLAYPDLRLVEEQRRRFLTWAADVAASWQAFYTNPPPSRLREAHCAVFVSRSLLEEGMTRVIGAQLRGSDQFVIRPGGRISASWEPMRWDGRPRLRCEIEGRVRRVCDCLWSSDVDTNVVITLDLAQPFADNIHATLRLDWYPNAWTLTCCTLQATLLWPAVGSFLLAEGRVGVPEFAGALAGGPLATVLGAIYLGSTRGPGPLALAPFRPARPNEQHEYVADLPTRIAGSASTPSLDIIGFAGAPDGLTVLANFTPIRERRPAQLAVGSVPDAASWSDGATCGGARSTGSFRTTVSIELQNRGEAPLFTCFRVLDDPDGIYAGDLQAPMSIAAGGVGRLVMNARQDVIGASLTARGATRAYPFRILVASNGGSRILTVAGPDRLDAATEEQFRRAREGYCAERASRAFGEEGRMRMIDLLGDPPDERTLPALYQIFVNGLPDTARFAIEHAQRGMLAESAAGPGGALFLTAAAWHTSDHAELALARLGDPIAEAKPTLTVRRLELSRAATLDLAQPLVGTPQLAALGDRRILALVAGTELLVVDITNPATPALRIVAAAPEETRTIAIWGSQLLVGGKSGLSGLPLAADTRPIESSLAAAPIHALAAGDRLWVLTGEGLLIIDPEMKPVGRLELPGHTSMALTGTGVLTSDGHELVVVNRNDENDDPTVNARVELPGSITGLGAAVDGPGVYIEDDQGGAVIDVVTKPGTTLARYREQPWFARATTSGSLLALPASHGREISLFEVAGTGEL